MNARSRPHQGPCIYPQSHFLDPLRESDSSALSCVAVETAGISIQQGTSSQVVLHNFMHCVAGNAISRRSAASVRDAKNRARTNGACYLTDPQLVNINMKSVSTKTCRSAVLYVGTRRRGGDGVPGVGRSSLEATPYLA